MTYDVIARARRARRRRRRRLAVALTVLAAMAVAVVFLAIAPNRAGDPSAQTTQAVPAGGAAAASTGAVGGQPEPGTAASLPGDLVWTQVAGVSLPTSAHAGPRDTAGGLARGFAHTKAGAVLAAVHLLIRVAPQVGPAVFDPTLRAQVVGPAAPALHDQVAHQYQQLCDQAHVAYGPPVGSLSAALRGYRIELYTDTTVTLRVMTETDRAGTAPLYAAAVVQLTWTGSDWALVAPDGGVWDRSITKVAVDNVGTYNPFDPGR